MTSPFDHSAKPNDGPGASLEAVPPNGMSLAKARQGNGTLLPLERRVSIAGRRSRRTRWAPRSDRKISLKSFFEEDAPRNFGKRRIRVCVPDVLLQIGGAEWFTTLLMQHSNPNLFEFIFLCYRPEEVGLQKYAESLGIKVASATSVYGLNLTYDQWRNDTLFTMLDSWSPDIVFFSSQYLYGEISSDRIRQYRVVVRISNFDRPSLDTLDFAAVDQLICCSEEQYAHLGRTYPNKVRLIKTGVDLDQFRPLNHEEKLATRREIGLGSNRRVVLFCGRLGDPLKRTFLFRQVVDRVLAERNDVTFLVVGYFERHRNADEQDFKDFVQSRGIVWKSAVRPWETGKYFNAADVLLSVSAQGEGLSNTVLQGLASGLVSVVTSASGMSDLIKPGENGFVLEDEDPSFIARRLLQALDLPKAESNVVRRGARQRAELLFNLRDSVRAYARTLYDLYRELPVRVAIIDGVFGIGGAEWLAALLCLNCNRAKVEFFLLVHRNGSPLAAWLAEQGIRVLAAPPELNYTKWSESWLPKTFRTIRPHVVMPCTSTTWNFSGGDHRLLGISQNASDGEVLQESHYENADYIICVSQDVRAVLDQRYHYKMTVLRNSIDTAMFHRNKSARRKIRSRIGCTENQRVVLWCGRLSERRKRVDVLREVIEKCSDCPRLHFLVLGYFKDDCEQRQEWESLVRSHNNITWISGVTNWETPAYYSAADFYLSTSGYTGSDFEGLSLASVQALAAGLPIVSTSSGGQSEVVSEGMNGYLTPTGDSCGLSARLKNLCQAPGAQVDAMRKRNVRKAQKLFSIKAHARRYETICWSLKNTVDAVLPYDAAADTELLQFDDADRLSGEQRHRASFFINHLSPLLRDNSKEFFSDQAEKAACTACNDKLVGPYSENTVDELSLLWSLAGKSMGSILEMGCFLHRTTILMARNASHPLYVCDPKHRMSARDLDLAFLGQLGAEHAVATNPGGSWLDLCRGLRKMAGVEDRIQQIGNSALQPAELPGLGLIILHKNLSHQEIKQGLALASQTIIPGGFLVLSGCGFPTGSPNAGNNCLLGTPASALLEYMAQNFPLWCQPFQIESCVVLQKIKE